MTRVRPIRIGDRCKDSPAIPTVEVAALEWVDFFNTQRPHEYLDDLTPVEVEKLHYDNFTALPTAG